jgi:hypothetical protein
MERFGYVDPYFIGYNCEIVIIKFCNFDQVPQLSTSIISSARLSLSYIILFKYGSQMIGKQKEISVCWIHFSLSLIVKLFRLKVIRNSNGENMSP